MQEGGYRVLREATVHTDWCDKTMSMLREKQFEACERRLNAHPSISLFSQEATELDAQKLWECSYYRQETPKRLMTLADLRERVLDQLPMEVRYLSREEMTLLERLLICDGTIVLGDWDDIGAAEALVSRLWCSFHNTEDVWSLELPVALHEPLLIAMNEAEYQQAREILFRYEAMIMGLLYIAGFLHSAQPIQFFLRDVIGRQDKLAVNLARRYLQSAFEYMADSHNELILLHPGLADPYRLISSLNKEGLFTVELSQEMMAGGMNGLFAEEIPLNDAIAGALCGSLRPEYDLAEVTEDLRMLAKQGVSLSEMEAVMSSMLCVLPTRDMKRALEQLHQCTPHWIGLKALLQH
jgi:hypothetical protein